MIRLLLLLSLILFSLSAFATTFNVTDLSDSGNGTLREAVTNANADASASEECPHQIIFLVSGTVNLTSKLLISENIEIRGNIAGTIIDGGGSTTMLVTTTAVHLSLLDLTFQNAYGALTSDVGSVLRSNTASCSATILRCTFLNNGTVNLIGGTIYFSGSNTKLIISDCLFDGNSSTDGGAVYIQANSYLVSRCTFQNHTSTDVQSKGALMLNGSLGSPTNGTVKDCYFYNNQGIFGAGLRVDVTTVLVENCLFEDNDCSVGTFGRGGGIYLSTNSTSTINNCTFQGNVASSGGGAGIFAINIISAAINNCTFSNNTCPSFCGGGLGTAAINNEISLEGNIFYNNTPSDIRANTSSPFTTNNFNIVGTHSITGGAFTPYSSADPLLGPLQDNGGATKTMEPGVGSIAIDAMGASGTDKDQRGFERGSNKDIGALETGLSCNCIPSLTSVASEPGLYRSAVSQTVGSTKYFCDDACNLLLALEVGTSGAVIPDNGVEILIEETATYYSTGSGFINNPNGGATMPRSWTVKPTTQPSVGDSVGVLLYFTPTDQTAVVNALDLNGVSSSVSISDYQFYKANIGNDFDPVCELSESDISLLMNGASPTKSEWKYNSASGDEYATFYVSSFSGGGGGVGAGGTALLPVEWLSFNAQKNKDVVLLDWSTASEKDNLGFHIERQSNDRTWKSIGFAPGENNLSGGAYRFEDSTPLTGINYYRLAQEDDNGTIHYSEIKAVHFDRLNSEPIAFPNPTTGVLQIQNLPKDVEINLYNTSGQLVLTTLASQSIEINLSQLPSGFYLLQSKDANNSWQKSIIKK